MLTKAEHIQNSNAEDTIYICGENEAVTDIRIRVSVSSP